MKQRCKSEIERWGEKLRCEGHAGHQCAHYNGRDWWPNKRGLPRTSEQKSILISVWTLAVAVVIVVIVVILALR